MNSVNALPNNLFSPKPLTQEAVSAVREYCFSQYPLQGALGTCQSLANRVAYLRSLPTADVKNKDIAWAIAKCALTALLTGISVFSFFFVMRAIPDGRMGSKKLMAMDVRVMVPIMLMGYTSYLFNQACKNATQLFKRPSQQQIQQELAQIVKQKLSPEERDQMTAVIKKLDQVIKDKKDDLNSAKKTGNELLTQRLEKIINVLEEAINGVQSLNVYFSRRDE